MKVLHVITGLQQGGAEAVLYRLVEGTQGKVEHVVVSLCGDGYYGSRLRACGAQVHVLDMPRSGISWRGLKRLHALAMISGADVVQTWMYHANLLGGLVARLAGLRAVVWSVHNLNLDPGFVSLHTRVVGHVSAWLSPMLQSAIVYVSEGAARVHGSIGYRSLDSRVISNGIDLTRFRVLGDDGLRVRAELGVAPAEFLLGFVARWDRYKDHGNLFAALESLGHSGDNIRCLLVGPGMDPTNDQLMKLIADYGLSGRILLAGSRDDVPAIMNAIDMHVLSSIGEGFGNVTAEAMACGTPCVTTDVGSGAEIVGNTGWIVAPASPAALAAAIQTGKVTIEKFGKAGLGFVCRERILQRFSLEVMVQNYVSLWESVMRRVDVPA